MIIVILAAGKGKRLMPLTADVPKTILEINGKTVLEYILENCINIHTKEFIIVVGHKKEKLADECNMLRVKYNPNIHLVENKKYFETNTGYSLHLALKRVNDDILIINGDNIFDEQILTNLLKSKYSAIVIDNVKKLDGESFKVDINKNIIKNMGKEISVENSDGEFIGISKVNKEDIVLFKKILFDLIEGNPQQYYDIAFRDLSKKISLDVVYTNGLKWTEIDTFDDLEYAKKLVHELKE